MPVVIQEDFDSIVSRLKGEKSKVMVTQKKLLEARYDLADRVAQGVKMSRGKPVQAGVRVRLQEGVTWESLAGMSPEEIRAKGVFPKGFLPLPHAKHPEGGMVFPAFHIEEIKKQ